MKQSNAKLQVLTWREARDDVKAVNPKLAEAIDRLDPSDRYKLVRVKYPYGQHILKNGHLQLPDEDGHWHGLHDKETKNQFREMLSYGYTMPTGVVLKKSIELYLEFGDRVIPFGMMTPGKIFALWTSLEVADSAHTGGVWNITSGARSLIMLPKISDASSYRRLQTEFQLPTASPKSLSDQRDTFLALADSQQAPGWESELLFFSANWFEDEEDEGWRLFRYHLMSTAWHSTAYLRNEVIFDFAFSCALVEKNLKPNPYLADTVKHLYGVGAGNFPGFVIAIDDSAAPIDFFQQVFDEIYDTRHIPTIVHPGYHSSGEDSRPCYYSLQFPTLMSFSPKSRKASSKLDDIKEIKHIMARIQEYFLADKLNLRHSPLYQWADHINYDYFHTDTSHHAHGVKPSVEILDNDSMLKAESKRFKHKSFCETSPFVRGCIQVLYSGKATG